MRVIFFLLIGLLSVAFIISILFFEFYNYDVKFPDTIIVLGHDLHEKSSKDIMEYRILKGLESCDNNTRFVILTGGYYNKVLGVFRVQTEIKNITEAKVMKELWEKNNKKCNAMIILEEESTSTFENAVNSIKIMNERNLKYAAVSSSENLIYHSLDFYLAKIFYFSKIRFDIHLN